MHAENKSCSDNSWVMTSMIVLPHPVAKASDHCIQSGWSGRRHDPRNGAGINPHAISRLRLQFSSCRLHVQAQMGSMRGKKETVAWTRALCEERKDLKEVTVSATTNMSVQRSVMLVFIDVIDKDLVHVLCTSIRINIQTIFKQPVPSMRPTNAKDLGTTSQSTCT